MFCLPVLMEQEKPLCIRQIQVLRRFHVLTWMSVMDYSKDKDICRGMYYCALGNEP